MVVIAMSASVALGLLMPPVGRARRWVRFGGVALLVLACLGLGAVACLLALDLRDAALAVQVVSTHARGGAARLWRAPNPPREADPGEDDDPDGGGGGGGGGSKRPPRPRPQSPVDWDWDAFDRERQAWDRGGDRPPQRI